jgi:hypothetical protein
MKQKFILFLLLFFGISADIKLLVKFPTRSRSQQFFKQLDNYHSKLSGKTDCQFLISCDTDDKDMNNPETIKKLQSYKNLHFYFGDNKTKMEAINADVEKHLDFDILLLASDDMTPIEQGYDLIIAKNMKQNFPDMDGVLHFNDGRVGDTLNTICILGKKYYDRFNYIYYPGYISVACDVDFMLTSQLMGKAKYIDQVIIRHDHPSMKGGFKKDALFLKNECKEFLMHDKEVLQRRKAENYGLKYEEIVDHIPTSLDLFGSKNNQDVMWSILIPTLDSRTELFTELYRELLKQIEAHQLYHKVEVLFFKDNKHHTVGYKRNSLIQAARGKYTSFVDDDDEIHKDYVKMIYDKLLKGPDCVSLTGIITQNGNNPQTFIHSLRYKRWFSYKGIYYRPPNHLNPIKKNIAIKVKFANKNNGEDAQWSMQIQKLGLLKTQEEIDTPYYFYKFTSEGTETQKPKPKKK